MSALRALATAVAGAALTSILYAAAFPPLRFSLTAWFAMVPFLVAVRRLRLSSAIVAAIAYPILACALTIAWMPRAASTYYNQPLVVGAITFLGIALVMVAPYVVAFTLLYRRVGERPSALLPLYGAAFWVCAEYARSYALSGNPFVLLGYSQANVALVRQIADVTGVYGVTFVIAAVNVALAELLLAWGDPTRMTPARRGLIIAGVMLLAVLGYGAWRSADVAADESDSATRVLLVQGNLDLGSQWRDELYGKNLDVYLRLTVAGMKSHSPQLVVWPENAMTFFLAREPLYRLSIGRVLSGGPVQLLAGGPHYIEDADAYLNSAFLIDPSGEIMSRYDKQKLLPFAEYFPWPQLDVLQRNFGRVRQFTPGAASELLSSSAGKAGLLICNEAMFPDIARQRTRSGAEVLINLANDSWIGDAQYAELALDMSVFRAVEQRRDLIRSSTSGPSAVVDARGEIRARTSPATAASIASAVARRTQLSPYARLGDCFVALCAALAIAGTWRARQR